MWIRRWLFWTSVFFFGSCAPSEKYLGPKQSPPISHNDLKKDGAQLLLSKWGKSQKIWTRPLYAKATWKHFKIALLWLISQWTPLYCSTYVAVTCLCFANPLFRNAWHFHMHEHVEFWKQHWFINCSLLHSHHAIKKSVNFILFL